MSILINKKVKAILKGVLKESDAHSDPLAGVHLQELSPTEAGGKKILAETTNGAMAFRLTLDTSHPVEFPFVLEEGEPINCVVPAMALEAAISKIPKKSTFPILENALISQVDNQVIKIGSTDQNTSNVQEIRCYDNTFPLIQDIVPSLPVAVRFSISAKQMKTVCDAYIELAKEDPTVGITLELYGEKKPIRITSDCKNELETFLMPIRPEKNNNLIPEGMME